MVTHEIVDNDYEKFNENNYGIILKKERLVYTESYSVLPKKVIIIY